MSGTWIRVDTTLPGEPTIGQLCERLGVDSATAVGLFVCAQLGLGEYQQDGVVGAVTDTTLEEWAKWKGERGRFAALFRTFAETREGQPDAIGVLRGWWRNAAPLRKQARDRQRPFGGEPPPADFARDSRGNRAGFARDVDEDVDVSTTNDERPLLFLAVTAVEYAQRCVGMANRGLRDNPNIGSAFNELTASNQDVHHEWMRQQIPVAVAERAIYERATHYRPTKFRHQPTTLRYFSQAVEEAWEREQSRQAVAQLATPTPEPRDTTPGLTEAERCARQLEAEARQEVQHG